MAIEELPRWKGLGRTLTFHFSIYLLALNNQWSSILGYINNFNKMASDFTNNPD